MKRFMLCLLLLSPLAAMAQAPSYPVRLDLQSPSRTFALKWAAGSSPILSAYVSDGGRAYTNLSGWTGYVYVAVTPTAGVYVAASPVASNRVNFSFTASQTATVGVFGVEVVLGNGTNTYRWGTGTLALSNSPALLGAGTVPLTGVFNWDLFSFTGTPPALSASYTNELVGDVTGVPGATVIGDGVVGTNNLNAEVRTGLADRGSSWSGYQATQTIMGAGNQYVSLSGGGTETISNNAYGASQVGRNEGSMNIGQNAYGAVQRGYTTATGVIRIESGASASHQSGIFSGIATISTNAIAAFQNLYFSSSLASAVIGPNAYGAMQFGYIATAAYATNNGAGAVQILFGDSFIHNALTTSDGDGSLMVGPGTISNRWAFTVGPTVSHGESSITAAGDIWSGSNNVTELAVNAARQADFASASNTILGLSGTIQTGVNARTVGNYLPSDFVLLTTLNTGGYLRITSGAVTSNSMPGTRGEYRRSTTNAYFHDGSQWITWSVSTNFSH